MALPLYLAMTAAEMGGNAPLPPQYAYMACHFSPYALGLGNLPRALPGDGMLILNDRIPWCGHDPGIICDQMALLVENTGCHTVLLDFQQPKVPQIPELISRLLDVLPCPVGVSQLYGKDLQCPVLLPPAPLDMKLQDYLAPWRGREVWLEAALDGLQLTLTETGCQTTVLPHDLQEPGPHRDEELHCHYQIQMQEGSVTFLLQRTREDLLELLTEAEDLGVTLAVGLWQELGNT